MKRRPKEYDEMGRLKCLECEYYYEETYQFGTNNRKCSKCMPLRRLYGLNTRELDKTVVSQGGRCLICYKDLDKPCVDHSHVTGLVRGVLCFRCNLGLGYLEKSHVPVSGLERYLLKEPIDFSQIPEEYHTKYEYEIDDHSAVCISCGERKPHIKFAGGQARKEHSMRKICKRCRTIAYEWKISYAHIRYMYSEADYRCEICLNGEDSGRLVVDHRHSCCPLDMLCLRCIRGILCDRCNKMIGYFNEDIEIVREAKRYVRKHS